MGIDDLVIDFYYELFDDIFVKQFADWIDNRLKRDRLEHRVRSSALTAQQSMARYFYRREIATESVILILDGFRALFSNVPLEWVSSVNIAADALAADLLKAAPSPSAVEAENIGTEYRLALRGVARDLSRLGPVFADWRKLGYPHSFDSLTRALQELEDITVQVDAIQEGETAGTDARDELDYRE